jgi:Uma2 family endonuclease
MSEPAYLLTLPEDDGQAWPVQGGWTYEDYLRLPADGRRYEVIRGFLYVTPAPSFDHQYTVWQLGRLIGNFVADHRLGVVLGAPFDIRLPRSLGNPVQPDILFIRSEQQPRAGDRRFDGAPDLVVEVLSPGNRNLDRTTKRDAYREAGVPEVWLVDPLARTVEVLVLAPGRTEYLVKESRREGERVGSSVLAGLRINVSDLFPSLDR